MNENSGKPDQEQGLYRKYDVTRLNDPAGKHAECTYYVLDLDHDPHSVAALLAYASSCEAQYPGLAFDLRHTAAATARKLNVALPEATFAFQAIGYVTNDGDVKWEPNKGPSDLIPGQLVYVSHLPLPPSPPLARKEP